MINNLTGLRFFMAYWVVLYHVREAVDIPILSFIVDKGYLGVDVFFILSGYILTYVYYDAFFSGKVSGINIIRFLGKRIARIYPLHLATLLFAIIFEISLKDYLQSNKTLYYDHIIPQLLLIHAWGVTDGVRWNFPSWSISAEWFAYLFVFPLSYSLFRKFGLSILSLISFIICLFVGYVIFNYFENDIGMLLETGAIRIIPEFLLGSCAYLFFRIEKLSNLQVTGLVFFLLVLTGASIRMDNFQYAFVGVVPFFLTVLHRGNFIVDRIFGNKVIVFLGEISYSLYMFHFFSRSINGIVHHNFFGAELNSILYFVNYTALTIIFAVFGYYTIEMPGRRFINRRIMRQ